MDVVCHKNWQKSTTTLIKDPLFTWLVYTYAQQSTWVENEWAQPMRRFYFKSLSRPFTWCHVHSNLPMEKKPVMYSTSSQCLNSYDFLWGKLWQFASKQFELHTSMLVHMSILLYWALSLEIVWSWKNYGQVCLPH